MRPPFRSAGRHRARPVLGRPVAGLESVPGAPSCVAMHRLGRVIAITAFIAPVAVAGYALAVRCPEGLERGWWGSAFALATLALASRASFSTVLPGGVGWLAGMAAA